ncbi:hypothetical protein GCM10010350_21770 [Streptomyces galilaeus]|nr:hypothetical protein GCM10010350_21770 [Streptomyces galilaeus]
MGLPYLLQPEPVDGRPERVPHGRAEQGAPHATAKVLLLGTPPDGPACRTQLDLPGTVRSYDCPAL